MSDTPPLIKLAEQITTATVLCIGDVMLDRFISGAVERISPEAPIPILQIENEKIMLGGSGNVARNISSLGGAVQFISVIGEDAAGEDIEKLLINDLSLDVHLVVDPSRTSSQKSRFVSGSQQILRADTETVHPVSDEIANIILEIAEEELPKCGALMLSDYGKGVLSDDVLSRLIKLANDQKTPVVIDPKGRDYRCYRGAMLITPNRKELEQATGMQTNTDTNIIDACKHLIRTTGIEGVLVTRSSDGMSLIMCGQDAWHLPADARAVFDVSGAGDTVAAAVSLSLAAGGGLKNAATLANSAAGIVVGKVGTATVKMVEVLSTLSNGQINTATHSVLDEKTALHQISEWQTQGLSVGFTNGCFDILHNGHRSLLQQARDACDKLVVAINTDESVRKLKGEDRPVNNEMNRAILLSSLKMVDAVILFNDKTPLRLIQYLQPNVLIKGADYEENNIVGADFVKAHGGRVVRAKLTEGLSTTATITRMKNNPP
jgi:D-beta-D-heptose 7-phosphate kinase/D-beta-D-heptose 1-phosphate adenosyltransferase